MVSSSEAVRLASKRLPMLPQRQRIQGPRNGQHLDLVARRVGDAFYRCAVEVAKMVYTKIDSRFAGQNDPKSSKRHDELMNEARKILNEARNDVVEAILPLFIIAAKRYNSVSELLESDQVAHDFIVRNVYDMMYRTYNAWADQFVEPEEVKAFEASLEKVAAVQRERLIGWLLNFHFQAKDLSINKEKG